MSMHIKNISRIMFIIMLFPLTIKAMDSNNCIAELDKKFTNLCNAKIIVSYCLPEPFTTTTGTNLKKTCNRNSSTSSEEPYYSHAFTLQPFKSRILPVRKKRSVKWVACLDGNYLISDVNGNSECKPYE